MCAMLTCLLCMKLNSGGGIANPRHTHDSSDTLLVSTVLGRLAEDTDEGETGVAASPWGAFIFAAGETWWKKVQGERKWQL